MKDIHIKKFYVVITGQAIGIFTSWEKASKLTIGRSNLNKSFKTYYEALRYLLDNLSEDELMSYGLDKKKPRFNKVITYNHH